MQLIGHHIDSPIYRLDNVDEEFLFLDGAISAGDSPMLITQGWEPSIAFYGTFGVFQKVQVYTSPDGQNFVWIADVTSLGVTLLGRNDLKFPAYAMKLSVPQKASGMTGVAIVSVSANNGTGNGTLTYTAVGQTLKWTSPGGVIGAAVAVGAGGTFTILDGTDPEVSTPKSITVFVTVASLPGGNGSQVVAVSPANINAKFYAERRHR
jgi:hypothetical protein